MDEKELKEIFEMLEQQGWKPMLCDTPVPLYDNEVACGVPNGVGDIVKDIMMVPQETVSVQSEFFLTAFGNSMVDVDIHDGDLLKVRGQTTADDGDVVLALLDGEFTIKTYCVDENGHPWLLPQNPDYDAICIEDYDNVRILGVVKQVTRSAPRVSYRTCLQIIKKAREQRHPQEISQEQVRRTIREMAKEINVGRLWFAVYKKMNDLDVVDNLDQFCEMVREEVPNHAHLPSVVELQRMEVESFTKSVVLWDKEKAPVSGKRFKQYQDTAKKTEQLLMEK